MLYMQLKDYCIGHLKSRMAEVKEHENCVDRLSCLPDSLIHDIFKFVDTKYAAQTCVLSSRWRYLWKSTLALNFYCYYFDTFSCFDEFVLNALFHCESFGICSLSFSRTGYVEPCLLENVVDYALSHKTKELNLDVGIGQERDIESLYQVFSCQSLEKLKLKLRLYNECQILPNSLALRALTSLYLERVPFSKNGDDCLDIFSQCMNLKVLSLIRCSMDGLEVFCISCPQLISLTFNGIDYAERRIFYGHPGSTGLAMGYTNCTVIVSCPKLTYVGLDGFPPLKFAADELPCLETVELDASSRPDGLQLIELLEQLGNVKFVILHCLAIQALSLSLPVNQPSPFHNLKSLKIKLDKYRFTISDDVKAYILHNSPDAMLTIES